MNKTCKQYSLINLLSGLKQELPFQTTFIRFSGKIINKTIGKIYQYELIFKNCQIVNLGKENKNKNKFFTNKTLYQPFS